MLKKFGAHVIIYGLSSAVTRALAILFTPVYTRVFHPSDYGLLSVVNSIFYLLGILMVFGMDYASNQFFFDHTDEAYKRSVLSNWFFFQMGFVLLILLTVFIGGSPLTKYLLHTSNDFALLILPAVGLFFYTWVYLLQNLYRFQQKAQRVSIFTLAYGIFNVGATALFILVFKLGLRGFLAGQLVANILFGGIAAYELRDWVRWKFFNCKLLKSMLKYAAPIVPTVIAFGGLSSIAIFVIDKYHDKSSVGLFSIGLSLASAMGFVTTAFQLAWPPFYLSKMQTIDIKPMVSRFLTYYVIICNLIWLLICLFTPEVLFVLTTKNYYGASWVPALLSLNFIFYGYSFFTKIGNDLNKNSVPLSIGMLLSSIVCIIGLFVFVPAWGINGAAIAISVSQLVIPFYVNRSSQKTFPVRFNWLLIAVHSLVIFAVGFAIRYYLVTNHLSFPTIAIKVLAAIAVVAGSYFLLSNDFKKNKSVSNQLLNQTNEIVVPTYKEVTE